jgi:hypothetical protein
MTLQNSLRTFVTVLYLTVSAVAGDPPSAISSKNPYAIDNDRACGAQCLTFLNSFLGGDETYETVAHVCPPGPQGVSLHQIQLAAESLGLHARGVKVSLDQLKQLPYCAILHFEQANDVGHFVVWIRWDGSQNAAFIFSPPASLRCEEVAAMGKYSGVAVLISDNPIPESLTTPGLWGNMKLWILGGSLIVSIVQLLRILWTLFDRSAATPASQVGVVMLLGTSVLMGCQREFSIGPPLPSEDRYVDERRQVDLGDVMAGEDLKHTFCLRNSTDRLVTVTSIEKTCNCQTASLKVGATIAPGKFLEVPYAVPTKGVKGRLAGQLTIATDSTHESLRQVVLTLQGEILDKLKAIPSQVVFGVVSPSASPERTLRVESKIAGLTEKYRSFTSLNRCTDIRLEEAAPGVLVFKVSLVATVPNGDVRDRLIFQFDDQSCPTLAVEIRAQKVGALHVIPNTIWLSPFVGDQPQSRCVRVKSTDGGMFRIQQIDCEENIVVDSLPDGSQTTFDLVLRMDPPAESATSPNIIVHSDRGDTAEIAVRYHRN